MKQKEFPCDSFVYKRNKTNQYKEKDSYELHDSISRSTFNLTSPKTYYLGPYTILGMCYPLVNSL